MTLKWIAYTLPSNKYNQKISIWSVGGCKGFLEIKYYKPQAWAWEK